MNFLGKFQLLGPPNDSKLFLSNLKEILEGIAALNDMYVKKECLQSLINVYLECPSKYPVKRIMASFFQNLNDALSKFVETTISKELTKHLDLQVFNSEYTQRVRHFVDTVGALLENFKMGERCITLVALPVMKYLVQTETFFLSQAQCEMGLVLLQQSMQHCHVTVQTINLVLQKTSAHISSQIIQEPNLLISMLEFDLLILKNESFLLDCRCCCAMNITLILQLAPSDSNSNLQIASLLLPRTFWELSLPKKISWLSESQAVALNMDSLSLLAYLALSYGYIAMAIESAIRASMPDGTSFYLDCLLPDLLNHGNRCNDTVSKALFGKTLSLWSSKLCLCLDESNEYYTNALNGETRVLQSLLDYVWTHWDDQLDVIRQSAKSVFENVLKIHFKISKCAGEVDSFISTIMEHLFSVSWTCKGKFSALTTCVRLIGAGQVLSIRPQLPGEIVDQLEEQALACYSAELYSTLFTMHHQEVFNLDSDAWKNSFHQTWLEPVVSALLSSKPKLKQNIIEYLLVKLMKHGDEVLQYLIAKLSAVEDRTSCGAIIMCLRKARILGLLKAKQECLDKQAIWYSYLNPDVLKSALCSSDQQIRLDAFGLLCENHKTTEPISQFEFSMLRFFIPCNLNNQSPAFRQAFLALSKKFFSRSRESLATMRKQRSKNMNTNIYEETIQNYQAFFTWLTNLLLSSLYPGSAFARRTTSLAMLSLLTNGFNSDTDSADVFCVPSLLTDQHRQILLECITDTFEENKKEAFYILSVYMQHHGALWDQNKLNQIFETSILLACSTRPQDCETAVYNFLLILRQQELQPNVYKLPDMLLNGASIRTFDTKHPGLNLLNVLLDLLDEEISVASQSLITAAATRPMYPTLLCIRYIMQELDFREMESDLIPIAKSFLQRLLKSCLTLSRIVSPVVQNSSPEGNMPGDVLNGPKLDMSDFLDNDNRQVLTESAMKESQILVESMPEYLVVCCWRSIKEVSLTLGRLCLQVPGKLITEKETLSLLTFDQVKLIGDYFSEQLLESIHRGAFELAYAGFQLMCQMLWSHPLQSFHQLPAQWLAQVMQDIKSEDSRSKFCITRRSAGVPFFIQAITSTEPVTAGRKCFHQVMKELLSLALWENNEANKSGQDSQIHAVNILRALYRDARLGEDVLTYVADGLKASILGFKSELWAIRNSSTLLLSALMTRIFGVNRSKDETAISKKNCQSGRSFFHQHPGLYPFLLAELKAATEMIQCKEKLQLHPSLYPVLLVLGRLYPSTIDNPDTNMSLSAFIPYVISCASSLVYKTRVIASRALLPLVRRNDVIPISQKLLANIPECWQKNVSNSLIHGSLLQLCQVMKLLPSLDTATKEEFLKFLFTNLTSRTWLISSNNSCWATWQLTLDLMDSVLEMSHSQKLHVDKNSILWSDFVACLVSTGDLSGHPWQPLYTSAQQTIARLCLKYLSQIFSKSKNLENYVEALEDDLQMQDCKDLLTKFLHSPVYEVQLSMLEALLSALDKNVLQPVAERDVLSTETDGLCIEAPDNLVSKVSHKEPWTNFNKTVLVNVAGQLFDDLLDLGLNKENYHLCLEKVYYVLASIPNCTTLLMSEDITKLTELFEKLLVQMNRDRRLEVKAAILTFSGQLVFVLYRKFSQNQKWSEKVEGLLTEWTERLKSYSKIDDSPVLQVSCCLVLLDNVKTILLDPEDKLGSSVFNAWDSLAYLLQEDDLDVKDVAASVLCAIRGLHPGDYHPSYALVTLPSVLLDVHGKKSLNRVIACLFGWIMDDSGVDIKESSERLFDKGEMNTYLDTVAFSRCVVTTLTLALSCCGVESQHSNLLGPLQAASQDNADQSPRLAGCLSDEVLQGSFVQSADILRQGLESLLASCLKSDLYLNVGRYSSLCCTLFKARVLLHILSDVPEDFQTKILLSRVFQLKHLVSTMVEKFELKNMLTSA